MKILLAVSGGKDSMTMSDLALRAAGGDVTEGFERFRGAVLGVAHCNFHLRPVDCEGDAALVEQWAGAHGLPFHRADFDTQAYAREKGVSVEMAARELRYAFFARLCRDEGYEAVAVAHNADDQAETLLLHLIRGCGLDGACGMAGETVLPSAASAVGPSASDGDAYPVPARPLLLRPLLQRTREEINAYTIVHRIAFREDKTNAEPVCQRNVLRGQVFPLLRRLNPSLVETLGRDTENFARSEAAMAYFAERAINDAEILHRVPVPAGNATVAMMDEHIYDVSRMPEPARPELLFRLLRSFGFGRDVLESVLAALPAFPGASSDGPRGVSEGKLFLSGEWKLLLKGSLLRFRPAGYRAGEPTVECLDWQDGMPLKQPVGVTVVDGDALPEGWTIRPWREGDWMCPLGMGGCRKKLSDLFTDLGFDAFDKADAWVLASPEPVSGDGQAAEDCVSVCRLESRSHVWALMGWRIDESVKIVPGRTRRLFRFSL